LNLLDNAIKFSPPQGEITIKGILQNEEVRVEISDSGPGIPPEKILRVKEPFFQADASDTRKTGGLGLGLAIVEKILEGHHTKLGIESTIGKGTCVHFILRKVKRSSSGKMLAFAPGPSEKSPS